MSDIQQQVNRMHVAALEPLQKVLGTNKADFDKLIEALDDAIVMVAEDHTRHQTERVLERLKPEPTMSLHDSYCHVMEAIDAELERLKEQSLPTNKDKETL